jgi:hypothetical protein
MLKNKCSIQNNITDIFWFPLDKVRNIGITKSPDAPSYAEGAMPITLECSAEGNPTPNFTWHKDSDGQSRNNCILLFNSNITAHELM